MPDKALKRALEHAKTASVREIDRLAGVLDEEGHPSGPLVEGNPDLTEKSMADERVWCTQEHEEDSDE